MKDSNDKYSKLLGDKLAGLREEPPAGMFDRIEQTLVAQGIVAEEAKSEPVAVVPLWRRPLVRGVAAAMVAAVVAVAVVVNMKSVAPQIVTVAQMPEMSAPEIVVEMPEVGRLAKLERTTMKASVESVAAENEEAVEITAPEMPAESPEEEPMVAAKSDARGERVKIARTRKRTAARNNDSDVENFWRTMLSQKESERGEEAPLKVGLYAANVGFNRGHVEAENVAGSSMFISEKNQHSVGGQYLAPSLVAPRENSHLEHFMPVTVGVTLSRALNGWLSVDSGLLYTNLYSVSESTGAISNYSMRRTMDYLGIPLTLSASFANLGALSFYGRLGGTAEICINANDKTYIDGDMANKSSLDTPLLTYSFDAAVGATYQLLGNMGIFGEVGCSYWLTPDDYPENYRTVHPLSLSSRFGLRFTFN